ncbi:DegT/DnrJ/EryC1/StrS family aminotransferase [Thalassobacillus pellis]|uniref:DegT/DnrJ/EryC1/StrS family aminotransferase n=1 Tax=Thalassobacillus pellis TaxID=748008 RepID=UPI0019601FB8|nr:DegT/DnrJ/EryC1/StrS family aminotransferase [Thalassobacillus pellis]MBM7551668.1 dTDP-4-amino-4,6-dideoxygalactose transaminase [Thalassobacillus pellis]
MNIPFSPPDISNEEIKEVIDTLKSGWLTTGPKTKLFEKKIAEYCNTTSAVCLGSATAAMELTLRLLGVGRGDEVITTAYTYTATASVIKHVGANIVLVDTKKDSFEMDYEKLEKAITKNTKVILPVDLGGVMCDYDTIFKIVNNYSDLFTPDNEIQQSFGRIVVLADAAHSFGATQNYKRSGEVADFTCFSFHAVKNLTTGEGGAVTWKDTPALDNEEVYHQYMLLSLHGQSKDALSKTKIGSWEYDILSPSYKCNMTDIAASLGLSQLRRYSNALNIRKEIIGFYDHELSFEKFERLEHFGRDYSSSGHLYLLRLKNKSEEYRNNIIKRMAEKGISTNVHYKPLPMHTAYKQMGFDIKHYKNSYNLYKNEISLPLHTSLTESQLCYIVESLLTSIKEEDSAKLINSQ